MVGHLKCNSGSRISQISYFIKFKFKKNQSIFGFVYILPFYMTICCILIVFLFFFVLFLILFFCFLFSFLFFFLGLCVVCVVCKQIIIIKKTSISITNFFVHFIYDLFTSFFFIFFYNSFYNSPTTSPPTIIFPKKKKIIPSSTSTSSEPAYVNTHKHNTSLYNNRHNNFHTHNHNKLFR